MAAIPARCRPDSNELRVMSRMLDVLREWMELRKRLAWQNHIPASTG